MIQMFGSQSPQTQGRLVALCSVCAHHVRRRIRSAPLNFNVHKSFYSPV